MRDKTIFAKEGDKNENFFRWSNSLTLSFFSFVFVNIFPQRSLFWPVPLDLVNIYSGTTRELVYRWVHKINTNLTPMEDSSSVMHNCCC